MSIKKPHLVMDLSLSIVFLLVLSMYVQGQNTKYTVDDFGAISDGITDSKQAFLKAWTEACGAKGGTLVIPSSGTYLLSDAEFAGPCIGQTKVQLSGTIVAPSLPTPKLDYWIKFCNLNSLAISGNGVLHGNGAHFWKLPKSDFSISSLKLQFVNNASIQSITSVNSKKFHLGLANCDTVSINDIHIRAPANSPNTDGIHLGNSNNIRIRNASIATGDDCISLGDGSTNVNISGVSCGPGHGISIGSLGRYPDEKDVRHVLITNTTFTQTTNGARIKTMAPSPPGRASDITFQHIVMNNVRNPIIIDQHYCPKNSCPKKGDSKVLIKNVKFIDIRGSSNVAEGVQILCSSSAPCQDIELSGVNLTFQGKPTIANCAAADVKFLGPVQVTSRCS